MSRFSALLLGFFVAFCLAHSAALQLETRGNLRIVEEPLLMASGDFNHDGKPDIAVVCFESLCGGVRTALGNGNGTFGPTTLYQVGDETSWIASGDLDGDGNTDLVTANTLSSDLSILFGNGDGTFQAAASVPTPVGPNVVEVGDFNGDGIPDLVIEDDCSGACISVLLGNGDGTFQAPVNTTLQDDLRGMVVGDFNGDGLSDVAWVSGTASGVNVFLSMGDGTFQELTSSLPGGGIGITAGDFNRDGNLDVAVSTGSSAAVLLGIGGGAFGSPEYYAAVNPGDSIQSADLTGDKNLDLIVTISPKVDSNASSVQEFLGKGDGTFVPGATFPAGNESGSITVADLNGDGQLDVAVAAERSNSVISLLNTGVVAFSPTTELSFPEQIVGTRSQPQTVKLTNTGQSSLSISSMKLTGQFGMTTTCGKSVAAGKGCSISVTFSPKGLNTQSGTISIVDSASSKPQVIDLTGTGTVVNLSPTQLNFGRQKVGSNTTLPAQMTNEGTKAVTITSIVTNSNQYTDTDNCGTSLAGGGSCTIQVTFSPTFKGSTTAILSVNDNGGGSPQTVALTGTGD